MDRKRNVMQPLSLSRLIRRLCPVVFSLLLWTAQAAEPVPSVRVTTDAAPPRTQLAVPQKQAYTGSYIDFGDQEDDVTLEKIEAFAAMVGKHQAIIGFSNYWGRGRFPMAQARIIDATGAIPLIMWNPWHGEDEEGTGTTRFDIARIAAGEFDAYLDAWGRDARAFGKPVLVSWGLEMNGSWFPWSGIFHGAGTVVPGTDPPRYQGPDTFIRTYRHVVDRVRAAGANNVAWVFHTNYYTAPRDPWNRMASYYPGPDYVDWMALSAYGKQFPDEGWLTVEDSIVRPYDELAAVDPTKPILLAEWGIGEFLPKGSKAEWIRQAFVRMRRDMPRLKGAVFWHERWQNQDLRYSNLRVNSSLEALNAYRKGLSDPFWLAAPQYVASPPSPNPLPAKAGP